MASLADLLRDSRFRQDVGNNARDFLQSASNTAASNVTAPIDGLAWLLRKAGVPVPQAPVGGSDWASNAGLMAEPKNKNSLASLLGEAAGNIAPIAGYAKAPQIAGGLNQIIKNANAPATLNTPKWHGQRGAIDPELLQAKFPSIDFSLSQNGDLATLSKIVVPKNQRNQGVGTEFMNALTKAADDDAARLALSPSSDFGGSKAQLVDFYKRFGFVPNKGRNIDFSISESMRRDPKP